MAALETLVSCRARREPLQYLLGTTEFYGREFLCDPRALVPRPDTETLVDVSLELIEELKLTVAADIGTGGGVIAVTLRRRWRASKCCDGQLGGSSSSPPRMCEASLKRRALRAGKWLEPLLDEAWVDRVEIVVSNPLHSPR